MKKYYLGLIILGLLSFGLSGYVLMIGVQSRQDVKTEKVAQTASEKINSYVSSKQRVPTSLVEVGVTDAPSTISYTKVSDKEYKFCATYKADKSFGGTDITSAVTGAALSKVYGSSYDSLSSADQASLYMNYSHKKGQECHTVKPYFYSSSSSSSSSSYLDEYCDPAGKYYKDYKDFCGTSSSTDSGTTKTIVN